jgi:hypothetical protein
MNPVERLLPKLQKVRSIANQKYVACCPAHPDRNPSLSIAIGEDGRALVHCHAGCEPREVVAAVGLSLADLFPDRIQSWSDPAEHRRVRALHGLRVWVQSHLIRVCRILRDLDKMIDSTTGYLAMIDFDAAPETPGYEHAWEFLVFAYRSRDEFETEFEILNGSNTGSKLELWRQYCANR